MDLLPIPTILSPAKLSTKPPHKPTHPRLTAASDSIRRPIIPSPRGPPKIAETPLRIISKNPLQIPHPSQNPPSPNPLSNKLFLSSKLSPPPPPPPPPPLQPEPECEPEPKPKPDPMPAASKFVQKEKIFVGNLPLWIKKNEIAEFFRQFGPLKNVILVKGHDDSERNVGYCFVIFGGPTAEEAASKAVEADGVEFRGRVLTIRLDDGDRLRAREEERERWVRGEGSGREYRSRWHEERDGAQRKFREVVESRPENWQAVVSAFERIPKVYMIFCIASIFVF